MVDDRLRDEARRDGIAVVVENRDKLRRIDVAFGEKQRAQLRVAVLLDDKDLLMRGNEIRHVVMERKAAHAQEVEMDAFLREEFSGLRHGRRRRAVMNDA